MLAEVELIVPTAHDSSSTAADAGRNGHAVALRSLEQPET
jgi:hypothetical protein